MNSIGCDILNDFEPRELPKPAPRFDSPPVPSVPEVSLVFDKPSQDVKNFDYNVRRSPSIDKYDSYATWKQTALLSSGGQKPRHSVGSSLERSHSNSEANQLHKHVIANESLRHSRSDPSLTKKIDVLNGAQKYERELLGKVTPNRQTMSSNADNMPRNNSHGQFDNNFPSPDGQRQFYLQERNRETYGDRQRQHNASNLMNKNDERCSTRAGNAKIRQQQADLDPKYLNCEANMQKLGVKQFGKTPNRLQSDYINPGLQNSNFHAMNSNNQNFHPNMVTRYHQFPNYCDSEYGYPYPHPHPYSQNVQSQRNENEETVKNLLQLINNQSEQIKSLQSQVERLLKIQEESLKDREKCNCARNLGLVNENYEQNTQFSIQTTNNNNPVHSSGSGSKLSRDDSMVSHRHNGTMERNMMGSSNIKEMKKNLTCDYNSQNHEGRLNSATREEQLKNKILEQKVSIGVMTSFEFTVQNNPFTQETEDHRPYYGQTQTDIDKGYSRNGNEGGTERGDASRMYQNVFSRVSNLPLENIIEDSESHLSLSQQPSSNFHSSPTIDEFKSSETGNRKISKNATVGKSPESNPTFFNTQNSEDMPENGRDNYSSHQRRELLDIQEHFRNTQRSQSPKRPDIMSTTQSPRTDNLPRHYSDINTPGPLDRRRQEHNDQNRGEHRNPHSPVRHRLVTNGTRQCNEQRESNSPYCSEDRQNLNEISGGRDGLGNEYENTGLLARMQEPRPQQSPGAYVKERNRMLTRSKSNQDNGIEESMVLNSGELEINEQPPPSPEPSIHVEMQEYSSDEDSDKHGGGEGDKQTPKVGWTFYNNVLGQVNQILQNSPITRNLKEKTADKENILDDLKNKSTVETVKMATMEQLRQLGISFVENNDTKDANDTSNKKVTFDSSYYPRLEYRGNMTQATSTISETDTSMHMNALALKYLSDEQLGELAMQKHSAETLKQLMVSNVQGTNMSFATMRYLERYQLLPTNNNPQADDERRTLERPKLEEMRNAQRPPSSSQMARMSCPSKILDISTLKQQPKLL